MRLCSDSTSNGTLRKSLDNSSIWGFLMASAKCLTLFLMLLLKSRFPTGRLNSLFRWTVFDCWRQTRWGWTAWRNNGRSSFSYYSARYAAGYILPCYMYPNLSRFRIGKTHIRSCDCPTGRTGQWCRRLSLKSVRWGIAGIIWNAHHVLVRIIQDDSLCRCVDSYVTATAEQVYQHIDVAGNKGRICGNSLNFPPV